jgi:hypothetical protein
VLVIVAGGAITLIGRALHQQQIRLEHSITRLEERLAALNSRTDTVALKLSFADQAWSRYTDQVDNFLSAYQNEFTRTVRETADLRGEVNSTLGAASKALTEAESARGATQRMRDSLGRSVERVGANVDSLSSDVARAGIRIESVTRSLSTGAAYDVPQYEPFDFPASPLRVTYVLRGRGVAVEIFRKSNGAAVVTQPIVLAAGQSAIVPLDGISYRLTLVHVRSRLIGASSARFHLSQSGPESSGPP